MNEGTNEGIKLGKVATKYAPDFTIFKPRETYGIRHVGWLPNFTHDITSIYYLKHVIL